MKSRGLFYHYALISSVIKCAIASLLLWSSSFAARSQTAFVELSGGLSMPLPPYSSPDLSQGCFTQPGFGLSFAVGTSLWRNLGAMAYGGYLLHPVDVSALGYQKLQADPFLSNLTIRSEPYRILAFMGGPFFQLPASKKLRLQGAPMAGWFSSRSPYQLHKTSYFMPGPSFYEITTSLDRSFAWGLTTLCSYRLTSCYEIGLGADFLTSKARFRFFRPDGSVRTDVKKINLLNIKLGIVFNLPGFHTPAKQ